MPEFLLFIKKPFMTNIPREEISYKKIYKNLDVDRKYKIIGHVEEQKRPTENIEERTCRLNLEKNTNIKDSQYPVDIGKEENTLMVDSEEIYNIKDVHYCADDFDLEFIEDVKINLKLKIEINDLEFIVDRLEKGWHNIVQDTIKEKFVKIKPQEFCDICTFEETDENIIIVCQGCGVSVHRDCYGSSYDKEEVFVCLCCIFNHKKPDCMFCDYKGGMMKMTTDCRWGHITCVLFDETLDFDNPDSREPIDISKYEENNGTCAFCKKDVGTKVQCSYGLCPNLYHVSCGLDRTYFDMANLVSYCTEHNPLKSKSVFSNNHTFFKTVVGYKKLKSPPSIRKQLPMAKYQQTTLREILDMPHFVPERLFNELSEDKKEVVEVVCCYWKLKKELNKSPFISFLQLKYDSSQ